MTTAVLAWLAVVAVTAVVAIAYRANHMDVVVGVLFAAASFSGITAPLGPYSVRLEQPALAMLIGVVVLREQGSLRRIATGHPWILAAAAVYLSANVISSIVYADRPVDSVRIAAWLGLSMVGGLAVASLVVRAPRAAQALPAWIVGAASIQVGVGLVAVLSEALLNTTWGVQVNDVVLGKIYGLSWEANILAINLAMALAFVVVPGSSPSLAPRARLLTAAWLGFGLGLSYSRGGVVGLVAAVVLVGALVARTARSDPLAALRRYLGPVLRPSLLALAAAILTAGALDALASRGVGWTPWTVMIDHQPTPEPHASSPVIASPGIVIPPGPLPTPRFVGTGDTVAVRLNNMSIALNDLPRSPLIGLGTDSFQQRHIEVSCRCPAHIPNLAVASLHDSGILGFLGLAGFLAAVLALAWRRGEPAYVVTLLAMIVGYQATDAFRFASNWIVMGALLGASAAVTAVQRETRSRLPA